MDITTEMANPGDKPPMTCTLPNDEVGGQVGEWVDLRQRAVAVTAIEGGVRMTLPAALFEDVQDLARREAGCCAFITIETSTVDDRLILDISSANPDARRVILTLAGNLVP